YRRIHRPLPMLTPSPPSHHDSDLFRRARHRRVEPALPILTEHVTLVEQIDIVPLAALCLVHGQRVAEGELVEPPPFRPAERLLLAREEGAMRHYLGLGRLLALFGLGIEHHGIAVARALLGFRHRPDLPVEQPLLRIVPQADQAVALDGLAMRQALQLTHA